MMGRLFCGVCVVVFGAGIAHAQDVPGIEICTVEKTMERRTSCLQSNVEFLQKTIAKQALDHQQKLDAARAQIEALKASVVTLQKAVDDLKAAPAKASDSTRKTDVSPAPKDASKDTSKDAPKDATKDGVK